jgi:tRNA threonylcarbamoyladenosine biosynthesis protein TsaB
MNICLLAIETSTEICSVALSKNAQCIAFVENEKGNSHAEKIILFIDEVLRQAKLDKSELNAVCISEGPGSYTGLRIGASSSKGLCDALNIPLIAVSTLQSMAWGAREIYPNHKLFSPMIDARRMEVYTAVYNQNLQIVREINNVILDENTCSDLLTHDKLVFSGNGVAKAQPLFSTNPHAVFCNSKTSARYILPLAYEKYLQQNFADIAYFEPFYLKEFHAVKAKTNT